MPASDTVITEKDAANADKDIKVRNDGTGTLTPYGILMVADAAVSDTNPFPVGGDLLTSLDAAIADILTAAEAIQASAAAIAASTDISADAVTGSVVQAAIVSGVATISGTVALGIPVGATRTRKYVRVTTAQTGTDVWDPTLDYFAVTSITIAWEGANACRITLWQGANADTTFSGTEPVLFDHNVDAAGNGGVTMYFGADNPWKSGTADEELHLTTDAAKIVTITINGYETDTAG